MASAYARRLGAEIAQRRRACGLTQGALAQQIDTTAEWISQIERGVGNPSFPTLEAMAAAFDATIDALLVAASHAETHAEVVALLVSVADRLNEHDARLLLAFAEDMVRAGGQKPARRSRRSRRQAA